MSVSILRVVFYVFWFFSAAGNIRAASIEILYVNSNTGAAAGGHAALKIGEDVLHYQFFPNERFLLVREPWDHFRLVYNDLLNRTIFSAECPMEQEDVERIRASFTAVLAGQRRDMFRAQALRQQIALLYSLTAGQTALAVNGLGFFDESTGSAGFGNTLRLFLLKSLGADFFEKQDRRFDRLQEEHIKTFGQEMDVEHEAGRFADWIALKKKQAAFAVLENGRGLRQQALLADGSEGLTAGQLTTLGRQLERNMRNLVDLLKSDRNNIGEALILQTARCHALYLSLSHQKLLTLDPFPDQAPVKHIDFSEPGMVVYLSDLIELLGKKRNQLFNMLASEHQEYADLVYTALEQCNGKINEIRTALARRGSIRLAGEYLVPNRSGQTVFAELTLVKPQTLNKIQEYLVARLDQLDGEMEERYSYGLIKRNCVTELLKTINTSFPDQAAAERTLGAWIEPREDHIVVPYDFFDRIAAAYRVRSVKRYPSRRLEALASRELEEDDWNLWLEEGNTLTSTLYRARIEDTPFLFFTDDDDLVWFRPSLGLANFVWAVLHGVAGIVYLPVDKGERLHQGVRGMFYSLPELFFFNIRKGTYPHEDLSSRTNEL